MKPNSLFIGIIESPFTKKVDLTTKIVGVVTQGGTIPVGVMSATVNVDGDDGTDQIAKMINESNFKVQIRAIFLKGLSVAGFNMIDVNRLHQLLNIPVIVITRRSAKNQNMIEALTKLNMTQKIPVLLAAPEQQSYQSTYYQAVGATPQQVKEMLIITRTQSEIMPEPLRLAHMVSHGI